MPAAIDDLSRLPLEEIARLAGQRRLPPVDKWNPAHCGHSNMRIAGDGTWFHEGRPITRPALVRLFSTILRREPEGSFVLVTPAEKLTIDVENAPFLAVEVKADKGALAFRLNTGDPVVAGADHPLRFNEPHPYLLVRPGLDALIARPVYYELAELALANDPPGLWSDGIFFPMGPAA